MKKSLLTILCTLLSVFSWAQGTTAGDGSAEAYAVLTDNQDIISQDATGITYGKTLTFYYDANKTSHSGAIGVDDFVSSTTMSSARPTITTVVFNDSFANCTTLTSTANWFRNMSVLTAIEGISNLKTDNVTNMNWMFANCNKQTSFDLSGFNTANVTDMSHMFEGCSSLTSLDLSGFNTANVTDMSHMFFGCSSLANLIISGFNTTNVTSMLGMFSDCSSLTGLVLTGYNTANVTDMSYMFSSCSSLTSLDVSGFNTDNVTNIGNMFYNCPGLTSLDVSSFNTANVKNMNWVFYGCSGLTNLDLSGFNTGNVTDMYEMFSGCSSLTTIYAGSEWSTAAVTWGGNMFTNCTNLVGGAGTVYNAEHVDHTYAHIDGGTSNPGYFTDKNAPTSYIITVTSYGNGQVSVEGVSEVVEDGKKAEVAVTAGGSLEMFFFPGEGYQLDSLMVNGVNVTADVVPATEQSAASYTLNNINAVHNVITFFGEKASYNEAYAVLVSEDGGNIMYATLYYDGNKANHTEGFAVVGLDEMLQNQAWMMNRGSIKTVNFDESFANCNPTSTAYWFAFCNSLTAINGLQYLNTEYVTNMEYMFHMCPALSSIDLSHFRAKSLTNMNAMFSGCSLLTSLDLSGFFTFTVTNMNYLFSGCTNLKTIYVNKYDWSTESVTAGDGVFENCTSLVGGAGTTFNDSHIDYTYARIDGGPNSTTPGYFTDKDATSKVATPTFSWNEHTLTVSSATEGATIVYNNLKENPVMVEGEGILLYQTYTYTDPLTIIENAELLFWAQKDGMANSDSITLNYPYTAWVALTDTLTKAKGIYDLALNNANVPDQMKSELASAISVGDSIYQVRNSSVDEIQSVTNRISVIANEVASLISAEDEPYAVLSENNTILTFYYDKQKTARNGVDMLGWQSTSETITTVNFDTSFAGYRPTSTQGWFAGCYALTTINGIANLVTDDVTTMDGMFEVCRSLTNLNLTTFNTANVTSMYMMFRNCSSLTTVDLSSFNTAKVTNMSCMFMDNSVLTTIYIGSGWSTAAVTSGDYVFSGCTNLMGGAGTSYDANHVDYTYARIDGGPNSTTPGYFTDKNAPITVAAPEFRFEGDNLAMTTETQNASIFYKVAELPSMAEAVVDSVVNSLIVTPDGQQSTYYEHPFELKMAAVVKAIAVADNATGTIVSDTTTMVYDYEAWVNLKAAVESGTDLYGRAQGNPNVDTQLLEQLQWALNEGDMIYNNRAQMDSFEATHFTQRINELCAQIEAQMTPSEHTVSVTAGANGSILYIIGTGTAAQEGEVPAESEVVLSIADKTQLELFPRPNDNYHWENVTLNDTINFNEYVQQNNAVIVLVDQDMKWKITFAENAPVQKVATPTFSFMNDFSEELTIQSETDGAEIYYRMNGRMLEEGDTDFASGSLRWSNWNVTGAHATGEFAYGSGIGYTDDYCLSLTNTVAGTSESAQATYTFKNALTQDGYYTLRFKARSQSGRGQLVAFCQNDTLPDTRSAEATFQIGSQYQDYSMMVRIPNANSNQIVLAFGTTVDTLFIDDVLFGPVISSTEGEMLTRYTGALNLDQGVTIEAIAKKDGMEDSKPAVFDYFYRGWRYLMEIFDYGRQITHQCYGDPNVPLDEVQKMEAILADMYSHYFERRGKEHVNDSELMSIYDEMSYRLHYLEQMRNGFTVDGVSYHAVDSTQVEVIPSLEGYYRGAITVPATVNYNNINFRVTTVAQNAFRSEYLTAIFWYAGFALTATDLQSSQNPNLLLYVTEASMAPTDRDNVVINGFAKNIRLSEGGNFHCPQAFTAEAISYTREFKQQTQIGVSRGWETIALPFTVQTITHEQRGVIAPFGNTASNTHFWLRRLTSNGLQAVPTIEANTAYLISMPNSEEYVAEYNLPGRVTFSAENATVPMTEIVKDESADYVMTPCFTNAAAKQGIYVLNVGEQRSGYPEGSIFESNYRAVLPFQAYVEHKGSNPAPPYFIVGDLGGDTTGIDATLVNSERVNSEAWYTLDGRKLQGKPTQKGVYITNGKKVIIK